MGAKQTKSCGSYADVKELEYISALHQTGTNGLRKDGSIRGTLQRWGGGGNLASSVGQPRKSMGVLSSFQMSSLTLDFFGIPHISTPVVTIIKPSISRCF